MSLSEKIQEQLGTRWNEAKASAGLVFRVERDRGFGLLLVGRG